MLKNNLKLLTIFFLTLGVLFSSYSIIRAQEEAEENSVFFDATASSKTTQKLKERIEKIVEEKKDQIKGIIDNLDSNKQGFIGEVQRISEEAITVKTSSSTKILPIDDQVELLEDGEPIELADIAVENWLVVMGIIEDDAFNPIRILVSDETLRPLPSYITLGGVTDISRSEITINPRSAEETVSVTLDSETEYEDINGEEIDRTDIEEDMQALLVGVDDDGERIAKRIRILTIIDLENE